MLERGFVMIDRGLLNWRWYKDANTMRLFFHLLMTVNYEGRDFEDIRVHRGQRIVSLAGLADELGMSVKCVRTALKHLEKTGDVAKSATSKYTVITVNSYDAFILRANEGHAEGTQGANDGQAKGNNEIKNNKYNNYNKAKSTAPSDGFDPEKYKVLINRF